MKTQGPSDKNPKLPVDSTQSEAPSSKGTVASKTTKAGGKAKGPRTGSAGKGGRPAQSQRAASSAEAKDVRAPGRKPDATWAEFSGQPTAPAPKDIKAKAADAQEQFIAVVEQGAGKIAAAVEEGVQYIEAHPVQATAAAVLFAAAPMATLAVAFSRVKPETYKNAVDSVVGTAKGAADSAKAWVDGPGATVVQQATATLSGTAQEVTTKARELQNGVRAKFQKVRNEVKAKKAEVNNDLEKLRAANEVLKKYKVRK